MLELLRTLPGGPFGLRSSRFGRALHLSGSGLDLSNALARLFDRLLPGGRRCLPGDLTRPLLGLVAKSLGGVAQLLLGAGAQPLAKVLDVALGTHLGVGRRLTRGLGLSFGRLRALDGGGAVLAGPGESGLKLANVGGKFADHALAGF